MKLQNASLRILDFLSFPSVQVYLCRKCSVLKFSIETAQLKFSIDEEVSPLLWLDFKHLTATCVYSLAKLDLNVVEIPSCISISNVFLQTLYKNEENFLICVPHFLEQISELNTRMQTPWGRIRKIDGEHTIYWVLAQE